MALTRSNSVASVANVRRNGSILGDQDIVGGNAANQGAAAAYSFSRPYGPGDMPAPSSITKPNAPDPVAAAVFGNPPGDSAGLDREAITTFLNQYGPHGFNSLSDVETTLLTSMATAVAKGSVVPGGGAENMVMNFMKNHAVATAARSSLDETTDGNGIAIASGGATAGYGPTNQYGNGPSDTGPSDTGTGEPTATGLTDHPPDAQVILKEAFVDTSFKGTGVSNEETGPEANQAEQTTNGPNDGESTQTATEDAAAALGSSEGGEAASTVQVDTRGLRERFRSSAAYRDAFAAWSAS